MKAQDYKISSEKFVFRKTDGSLRDNKLETKPVSYLQDALHRFSRNKASILAAFIILLLVLFAYTLVLTICYIRSQALGTIKAIFVFSVVDLVFGLLALLPERTLKPMPFAIIVVVSAVLCVVAFIRMQMEIKRYDFD